jgi:putative redox protein
MSIRGCTTGYAFQYILSGDSLDRGKIEKAISLSQDKYCGVTAMLAKTADITCEVLTE